MKEIWKDVVGYEGLYKVSNTGKLFSIKSNRMIGTCFNKLGYNIVTLRKCGVAKATSVHRLVATAFIPKIIGKDYVDHIDGNPSNNRVENLRWCTQKENLNFPIAKRNKDRFFDTLRSKIAMIDKDNYIVRVFNGINNAERETGITTINMCLSVKKYIARTKDGYTFVYYNEVEFPMLVAILGL